MPAFKGSDLAALCERRSVSIRQLAELVGIHRNTLSRWVRNDEDVPLQARMALAAWVHEVAPIEPGDG
jgi:transcriptional regulator with XRE-family HTH domain